MTVSEPVGPIVVEPGPGQGAVGERSPLDQALDLLLYAPVGLAVAAKENLPAFVAKGRQRVSAQTTLARMIGRFAVAEGEREARRRIGGVAERLGGLGLLPSRGHSDPAVNNAKFPPAAAPPASPTSSPAGDGTESTVEQRGVTSNGKQAAAGHPRPSAELAIPGYDTLSASQVVQRLAGLAGDELDAVRAYETATRGRRTILSKIAQMQAGPSGR